MKIYRSFTELQEDDLSKSIITVGNFDGVHRGHRMIIDGVIERAVSLRYRSLAVMFEPHPTRVLRPEAAPRLITPLEQKLELLAATGLDGTLVLPFEPWFAEWEPDKFVAIVSRNTRARQWHEGESFRFGHRAEGNINTLITLGRERDFDVFVYEPYILRKAPVSSSRIRTLIAAGEVGQARTLLGRPFAIRSTPASGRGYGTRYTVPTINLAPYTELLPANGVYITTLRVGSGDTARTFNAVTNAGNRPTFGVDSFAVESHLLNFEPLTLTEDTPLELTFLHRLRGEIRFPSPEALREQIGHDVKKAQRYFALCESLTRAPKAQF